MTPTIVRFDPHKHSFAGFRTGVSGVDEFFNPGSDFSCNTMLTKRMGDILAAVDDDGNVAGCVAYTPRSAPDKIARRIAPALWSSKRQKPLDGGILDRDRDLVIPAYRIVILAVHRLRQGEGVGTALLRHVLSSVTAPIYYLHPDQQAIPFYQKFGFAQVSFGSATIMYKVEGAPSGKVAPSQFGE